MQCLNFLFLIYIGYVLPICADATESPSTSPSLSPSSPTQSPTVAQSDNIDDSTSSSISFTSFDHFSSIEVDPISDSHILRMHVEAPYFALEVKPILHVVSVSSSSCISPLDFTEDFNSWPPCSSMPQPQGNWSVFIDNAFSQSEPSFYNSTHLVDSSWKRHTVPPTSINGWTVTVSEGTVNHDIKYSMDINVGSITSSCGITPITTVDNDNYDTKLSISSFYLDSSGELVSSCEVRDIEVNVNHHTDAVASFSTSLGITSTIDTVSYETCTREECSDTVGPENSCDTLIDNNILTEESLFRRLVMTFDLEGADPQLTVYNISTKFTNCYGFGSNYTIDNVNDKITIRTSCVNMLYASGNDVLVDCDTFKTCSAVNKSDTNYDFIMNVNKHNGEIFPVAMDVTIGWTQCPAYTKVIRSIQMDSQIDFYTGRGSSTAVVNTAKTYTVAEEVVLTATLLQGSSSGAHNMRIDTVTACLLDQTVPDFNNKLNCILYGNCGALGTAFSGQTKGCDKYNWPGPTGNPFSTQYVLLHDFEVAQEMYSSQRCKTSIPTETADTGQCKSDECLWDIEQKNASNIWDAFRISSGPFLQASGTHTWVFDIEGDVEFCDQLITRRRRLQSVVALHPHHIRLRSSAQVGRAESQTSTAVKFIGTRNSADIEKSDSVVRGTVKYVRYDSLSPVLFLLVLSFLSFILFITKQNNNLNNNGGFTCSFSRNSRRNKMKMDLSHTMRM